MLTRLKVNNFKNLVDVDVRFGPFTCIAGANGVGKSNLFDAIRFLSTLADHSLMDTALSVRDEAGKTSDIRSLFHCVGGEYANTMSFEAEMIVPLHGSDDLGQEARASTTFLRYSVALGYHTADSWQPVSSIELLKEELKYIIKGDARRHLLFPHSLEWRHSALQGARHGIAYISTDGEGESRIIKLHQDQTPGRPVSRLAASLPRTVLSTANAAESPTALLARREMRSWRLLQLEPSSLRKPDEFTAPLMLGADGSHLPRTLYHLAHASPDHGMREATDEQSEEQVYSQIANNLALLIDDVRDVWVDRDDKRDLFTLYVTDRYGTSHPARALSDGTLRFLALTVLKLDPQFQGLLCLEEPENGIHPARIPAMLNLLQEIATDVDEPIGIENPLRQIIVNTHSPAVVQQVPEGTLLVAELREKVCDSQRFKSVSYGCLEDTWRAERLVGTEAVNVVSKGVLLSYLNPVPDDDSEASLNGHSANGHPLRAPRRVRRVIDRPDLQLMLPFEHSAK